MSTWPIMRKIKMRKIKMDEWAVDIQLFMDLSYLVPTVAAVSTAVRSVEVVSPAATASAKAVCPWLIGR